MMPFSAEYRRIFEYSLPRIKVVAVVAIPKRPPNGVKADGLALLSGISCSN
jgi:hypothetical protein